MKYPATWAWAIAVPVTAISGNPVWWPYWVFAAIAWGCCGLDVRDWIRNRRATAGVEARCAGDKKVNPGDALGRCFDCMWAGKSACPHGVGVLDRESIASKGTDG